MSSEKKQDQEEVPVLNQDVDLQQNTDEESDLDEVVVELAETFIDNPVLLERVMNTPGVLIIASVFAWKGNTVFAGTLSYRLRSSGAGGCLCRWT